MRSDWGHGERQGRSGYLEVQVITSLDAGELVGLLEDYDCIGGCEKDGCVCLYWDSQRWDGNALDALKATLRRLGDPDAEKTISVIDLPDQDWNANWAASLEPFLLAGRILIRQSWNAATIPAGGFELVIDPKRAFGTGYHATTQLIAEWLPDLVRGGERVLDVGTGTGILAMIALRLGVASAFGIDNDPEAIECATECAAVNGFGSELAFQVAPLEDLDAGRFDLVLANLDRKTLLHHFADINAHLLPGGTMLVSGLLQEDYEEICAALDAAGWAVVQRKDRDEWMALSLRPAAPWAPSARRGPARVDRMRHPM